MCLTTGEGGGKKWDESTTNTALLQCREVEEEDDSSAHQREGKAVACPGSPSPPPSLMPSTLCCTALPSVPGLMLPFPMWLHKMRV